MHKKTADLERSPVSRFTLKRETIRILTSQELRFAAAGECPTGSITSGIPTTDARSPVTCG
jgi:hypothetical protein